MTDPDPILDPHASPLIVAAWAAGIALCCLVWAVLAVVPHLT